MSNVLKSTEQPCTQAHPDGLTITQILTPRLADIGGVTVRRVFPTIGRKMIGPWVFFDEMGPVDFASGPGLNVPPHPHIGLATVTYLFTGEMLHRDSLGTVQAIRPGDINLMVAGRGVVHSERERPEMAAKTRSMHGLQLWLALPEADEQCAPAFHHVPSAQIPLLDMDGVTLRVMIGEAYGVSSPVPVFSPTLYLEAFIQQGRTLQLPDAAEYGVYVVSGALRMQGYVIEAHSMAVVESGTAIEVTASADTRIVLIGGEPLGKRHINWNFVASDRALISNAREDWEAQRFAKVPGDEDDFVPLPK
ncbi:MAG: pirin family protein [Idiomarina sp.]|nr:pirin family protein [Idiomarina sp.]